MSAFERTALINVRVESRQRIPIGLLTLAACVKDITRAIVFDPDPDDDALREVVEFKPELVGIGL